jgi:hypothetical protein
VHIETKLFISKNIVAAIHSTNVCNLWVVFETKLYIMAGVSKIIGHKDQQRTKWWLYERHMMVVVIKEEQGEGGG